MTVGDLIVEALTWIGPPDRRTWRIWLAVVAVVIVGAVVLVSV